MKNREEKDAFFELIKDAIYSYKIDLFELRMLWFMFNGIEPEEIDKFFLR